MDTLKLVAATDADKTVVERLLQLSLHDMTEFNPFPIGADGLYQYDFLDRFWQHPFLLYSGREIAGLSPGRGAVPDNCRFAVLVPG